MSTVFGWFTKGSDAVDLKDAKSPLLQRKGVGIQETVDQILNMSFVDCAECAAR